MRLTTEIFLLWVTLSLLALNVSCKKEVWLRQTAKDDVAFSCVWDETTLLITPFLQKAKQPGPNDEVCQTGVSMLVEDIVSRGI